MMPWNHEYYEATGTRHSRTRPSIEQPPKLELKPLLSYLRCTYLGESFTLPAIIASDLTPKNEDKLFRVL